MENGDKIIEVVSLLIKNRNKLFPWGQFHKTLWIRKLRSCSYGQILTINLLINNEEKSFMEQAPGLTKGLNQHTPV